MKAIFAGCIFVLILVGGFFVLNLYIYNEKQGGEFPEDYKNVTFKISGEPVTLNGGIAEAYTSLGGDSKTVVRYFGNEVVHDVDGDGVEDVVFLVSQEVVGSKVFFYAVGALKRGDGYVGTHAVYIGDRIAPQSTESGEGRLVIINYSDRAPGEPLTAQPSIGESLHLLLDTETLSFGEVVQNFEGESR